MIRVPLVDDRAHVVVSRIEADFAGSKVRTSG